ncbi:nuclear transport factor 2 family protein [Agrococcus baldri]|uniref:SnoaL-like domain-containing protein n=1 Tax=Agrococcus baldri TaxID=153730 RepID=A0AA87RBH5_9MICO|nr:nuclear transport factor 2 family protein [Agrococcus baldri]GEK79642.1 hypothetical protein ABA31_09930 [Agrococcus baldri]
MEQHDRYAIYEVLLRYARGVDRRDEAVLRSAYHPDGIDHHTGFTGTIDQFVPWVWDLLCSVDGSMHIIGNHWAELAGDVAVVETYGTSNHWGLPADDPSVNFSTGFRYVDHMTKVGGRWAIAERWAIREWTRSDVGLLIPKEGKGPSPARGPDDIVYRLKRKVLGPSTK